jgi:hypothetical protein
MSQLVIDNPPAELLVQIGDAVFANGSAEAAVSLYEQALEASKPAFKPRIVARIGLANTKSRAGRPLLKLLQHLEAEFPDASAFVSPGMAVWFKTNSFIDDRRFMALVEKHQSLLPIPNWHWNLDTALWAAWQCRDVPGDFVELGVFRGHTTLFLAEYLEFQTQPRRWFLYDTFEGIPEDQLNQGWAEMNTNAYRGKFSFEEVRDRFAAFPNIEVIKGRVPEILDERCPERIAFIHLDLNSAVAEIAALDRLYDRLSPGGVILMDDYCWRVAREQHVAERAWFQKRGLRVLNMPTGQGVFVKGA